MSTKPKPLSRQSSDTSTKPPRRNSFASATASSLAHGGPATMAPKHRNASSHVHKKRLPVPDDENVDTTNTAAASAPSTPNKATTTATANKNGDNNDDSGEHILSPTPYYKVLAERNGETSPRLTRSAKKKRMLDSLACLDGTLSPDEDHENVNNNNGAAGSSRGEGLGTLLGRGLHFESPSAFCATRHTPSMTTHTGAAKGERRNPMRDPSPARRIKKAKTDNNNGRGNGGVDAEQMRKLVTECLASDQQSKLALALEEKIKIQSKYDELCSKTSLLEERLSAKEEATADKVEKEIHSERLRWENEKDVLEAKVVELREKNVSHVEELTGLETKYQELNRNSGEMEAENNMLKMELQQIKQKMEYEKRETDKKFNQQSKELEETKAKLAHVQEQNEEKAGVLADAEEALEEANRRTVEMLRIHAADDGVATKLQGEINELRKENAAVKADLCTANTDLESKSKQIVNLKSATQQLEQDKETALDLATESAQRVNKLEQDLNTASQDLVSARQELNLAHSKLKGVQSPRSRSALEEQQHQEVTLLQNRIDTLESRLDRKEAELRQCQKECEELTSKLKQELEAKLKTVTDEKADSDQLLEELARENEGLLQKWEATKVELQASQEEVTELNNRTIHLKEEWNSESQAKRAAEKRLVQSQEDISGLERHVSSLKADLNASQQLVSDLKQNKRTSDQKITELSTELTTVSAHLQNAKTEITSLQSELRAKQLYCDNFEKTERELLCDNHRLNEIRRSLHNRVIQLSGNIRVFVRVRPVIASELQAAADKMADHGPSSRPSSRESISSRRTSTAKLIAKKAKVETDISPFQFPAITAQRSNKNGLTSYSDLTKQTIEIIEPYKDRGGLNPRQKKWKYGFDRVFKPNQTQDDIWEGAVPLVQSCLDGFNVTLFAYGQTGSGKTHTMIGDEEHPGLIPRSVELFFETKADIEKKCKAQEQDVNIEIGVELLEIYNEEVRDLLSPDSTNSGKLVKVDLNSHEAVGNVRVSASSKRDVDKVLQLAQSRRCVKATKSNAESSRSHLLFTIHFVVTSISNEELIRNGCLHIIDLAGSESLNKSGSVGALLKEACHINKSLSALTGVIEKLQEKADHVPFRDSKLTYLLRNSLGGDSKTLAIVCCSPQQEHFQESHNSIRFAAKASKVELKEGNKVSV